MDYETCLFVCKYVKRCLAIVELWITKIVFVCKSRERCLALVKLWILIIVFLYAKRGLAMVKLWISKILLLLRVLAQYSNTFWLVPGRNHVKSEVYTHSLKSERAQSSLVNAMVWCI